MSTFDRDEIERLKGVLSEIKELKQELPDGYTTSPEDCLRLESEIKKAEQKLDCAVKDIVPGKLYHSIATDGISYYEDRYFKITDVSKKGLITFDAIYITRGEFCRSIVYSKKESTSSPFSCAEECTHMMDYYNKLVDYALNVPDYE